MMDPDRRRRGGPGRFGGVFRAALMAFAALSAGAQAQLPNSGWTTSGFVDAYYGRLFDGPGTGEMLVGRQFSERDGQVRLAQAQVNVAYRSKRGRFALVLSPAIGDNVDFMDRLTPGPSKALNYLSQAYVTLTDPKSSWSLDLGKTYSWCGYEGPESAPLDVYTHSLLWSLGEPTYHVGARLSRPFGATLWASAYALSGWNQLENARRRPCLGAQVRYSPGARTSITADYIEGDEGGDTANRLGSFGGIGFPKAGIADTRIWDLIVTYQAAPKVKLAANANYASASGAANNGSWWGAAGYARYQATGSVALALRAETFQDKEGLRLGTPARAQSVTLCLDYSPNRQQLIRLEVRHDTCDKPLFGLSGGPSSQQTTITLAHTLRF